MNEWIIFLTHYLPWPRLRGKMLTRYWLLTFVKNIQNKQYIAYNRFFTKWGSYRHHFLSPPFFLEILYQIRNKHTAKFKIIFWLRVSIFLMYAGIKLHNFVTSLVTLSLKTQGQIFNFRLFLFPSSKYYVMNWWRLMLFNILFQLNLKHVRSYYDVHWCWPLYSRSHQY